MQPEQLAEALVQHPDAAAVCATLSETSTGVRHDIAAFGKLVGHTPAVLLVDAISGLGAMECRTDDWHIDVCVTGSQKALMLPPGLAFVSVSDKAWEQIDRTPPAGLLLRPEESARKPEDLGHAVHAGPHAAPGSRVSLKTHAGRGHRERLGAAGRDARPRRGPACRRWAWSCSPPAGRRLTVSKVPRGHRRHGPVDEAGETVRPQAGRRPGPPQGQDHPPGPHGLHRPVRCAAALLPESSWLSWSSVFQSSRARESPPPRKSWHKSCCRACGYDVLL